MDTIIKKKVEDLIATQTMFTSVNVANAIKTDGTWVRNRDVAHWLRNNFDSLNSQLAADYVFVQISVGTGDTANLYLPVTADQNNYTDTDLKAMTPDEFKALHGFDPLSTTIQSPAASTAAPVQPTPAQPVAPVQTSISADYYKITEFKSGRIRIPAELVKKLHLRPYNTVNLKKFDIDQCDAPKMLRVHSDGRISLPRKCIKVDNTSVTSRALYAYFDNIVKFKLV